MTLDVYYKEGKGQAKVYEDGQDGYDYKKGRFSLRSFKLTGKTNELIIQQHKEGKFVTDYDNITLKFNGLPFKVTAIELDNQLDTSIKFNGEATLQITKDFTELHLIGE